MSNEWMSRLMSAFYKLGKETVPAPDVIVPRGHNNKEMFKAQYDAAVGYMRAAAFSSAAEKQKDHYKELCKQLGVLGEEFDKLNPGSETVVYDTPQIVTMVKVAKPQMYLDPSKLNSQLIKALGAKKAEIIIAGCMSEKKPARSIIMSLK